MFTFTMCPLRRQHVNLASRTPRLPTVRNAAVLLCGRDLNILTRPSTELYVFIYTRVCNYVFPIIHTR